MSMVYILFIFRSGKVSKISVDPIRVENVIKQLRNFFSKEQTGDNRYLIIEDENKTFFVDLSDVSAIEVMKYETK